MPTTYNLIHDKIGDDLAFVQVEPAVGGDLPLVVVLHGLRSTKENYLETSYRLAQRGFRAVAMDLRMHGERAMADVRDANLESAYVPTMLGIIEKSVGDVAAVISHFGASKAAIHGISLGGVISFAALLADPRIQVAAIAMGTPDWGGMLEMMGLTRAHPMFDMVDAMSPLSRASAIATRPLLMLHGDIDETVPIDGVRKLRQKLEPLYVEHAGLLELVEYEGLGHHYSDDMIRRSVDWVERYL